MSRKSDLERHILESYGLIQENEDIVRLAGGPKERARARHEMQEQWDLVIDYLTEYREVAGSTWSPEIREIAITARSKHLVTMPVPPVAVRAGRHDLGLLLRRALAFPGLLISMALLLIGLCVTLGIASQVIPLDWLIPVVKGLNPNEPPSVSTSTSMPMSTPTIAPTLTPTSTPTIAPTLTPTSTPTIIPTPTLTPTSPVFSTATAGRALVIVADFEDRSDGKPGKIEGVDVAQYVHEEIQKHANKTEIDVVRLRRSVDDNTVHTVGAESNATLIVWGWYDSLSITPRTTAIRAPSKCVSTEEGRHLILSDPAQFEFRILFDVPGHAAYLAFFSLGQIEYLSGRYDQALEYLKSALAAVPESDERSTMPAEAHFYRGRIYYYRQMYDRALEDYDESIGLKPDYPEAYLDRGVVHYIAGDLDAARDDFSQAVDLDGGYAAGYFNRAYIDWMQQMYDAALEDYGTVIKLEPGFANAYFNRAIVYEDMERYEEALGDYTRAIQLDPQFPDACYNRGRLYALQQDYATALSDFTRALDLRPDDAEAYYARALVHAALGQTQYAVADLKRCLEFADDPELRQDAEQGLKALGQ